MREFSQTLAAGRNFARLDGSRGQTPREVILAIAEVKEAALRGLEEAEKPWPDAVFGAVLESLAEIRCGAHDALFPLDLAQGGAGTSLHMNLCEVLAALVAEKYGREDAFHFLDDGARSQSTNDVVTTAAVIVVQRLVRRMEAAVISLQEALVAKEALWRGISIVGRTEYQDALPMDLSLVAGAWAASAERDRWRLGKLRERSRTVALGGTALGSGGGAGTAYLFAAERHLRAITGLPMQRSQNMADAVAQRDEMAEVAGGFELVAANLVKLCRDLLLYTSSAVGELRHPALQWGSTAMPLKNNPVLVEFSMGLALRASSSCQSIVRFSQEGSLQLNAFSPFILDAFLSAADDLERALRAVAVDLLPRLDVDVGRCFQNLARSAAPLNALRADLPYEKLKALGATLSGLGDNCRSIDDLADTLSRATGLDRALVLARLTDRSTP